MISKISSGMTWNSSLIFEWSLLGGFILILLYTMRVIKKEKKLFLENPKSYDLKDFHLETPSWWSATKEQSDHLIFERLDTRYDWKASFEWVDLLNELSAEELFKERIKNQNILFDKDFTIIHNPQNLQDQFIEDTKSWDIIRIEGTATKDAEERLYYDAYLIKDNKRQGYLYCESVSSVLNGLIEGPYFEEVVKRLRLIDSSLEKTI